MNCMFLYSIRKISIFLTKSNPQIACSVNSVSGSVFKKKWVKSLNLMICIKIGMWTGTQWA